jgi:protease-4
VKKKTVVITVVIASCILVFGFLGLVILLAVAGGDGLEFTGFGPRVAVVELYGQIVDSRDFVRQIKRWTDDGDVHAIVLDINSPGGGVAASQEMYDQVLKARAEGKVVVASFRSVAASGGYYVACAADRIVSNPGTLTGSIGVILSFPTAKKLFDKIGIRWETVKSGELKDVGDWSRPMTPEEERMLKAVIDDTHEQFVEAVSEGRDRPKEEIYPLSDGSIFTGRQAYNLGLVDTLGTFEEAVSIAGEMAGLGSDPDVVMERKRKPGFLDLLYGGLDLAEKITDLETQGPALLYLYE